VIKAKNHTGTKKLEPSYGGIDIRIDEKVWFTFNPIAGIWDVTKLSRMIIIEKIPADFDYWFNYVQWVG
jgi:hypothetical protein